MRVACMDSMAARAPAPESVSWRSTAESACVMIRLVASRWWGRGWLHGQRRRYKRGGDRANHAGTAIVFVLAIQQEQCPMGRGTCATQFLDNAIPERRQVGHRSQVGRKPCDDVQVARWRKAPRWSVFDGRDVITNWERRDAV